MKNFTLLVLCSFFVSVATAQLVDPSFESPTGSSWTQSSTNFGTPLCDATCGDCGGGCVAHGGDWYAWFGGAGGAAEEGACSQVVTIPAGTDAELSFWFAIPTPGLGLSADYTEVTMDGASLWIATAADSSAYATYTEVTVDISAYADGNAHSLNIVGIQSTPDVVNFIFDDMNMTVDGTDQVGINELLNGEIAVKLYPNPAQEQTSLFFNAAVSGDAKVTIYAMNGALVSQQILQDIANKSFDMDTNTLENGMYSVVIETENSVFSERLVVSK